MFSAEDRRRFHGGGGCGSGSGSEGFGGMIDWLGYGICSSVGRSDLATTFDSHYHMAEEDSRTQSLNESSSKDADRDDDRWLQLTIGGGAGGQEATTTTTTTTSSRKNTNLVELELMPNSNNNNGSSHPPARPLFAPAPEFPAHRQAVNLAGGFGPAFFLQQHQGSSSTNFGPNQEINWAFRPVIPISVSSPSSSPATAAGLYFHPQPFMAAPGVDFRVVPPPRRPHSGIWFNLQASQNQEREPYLPQIAKSYLRIKDGRMTIQLVIKYLVNKLRLESESEIEIRCKEQRLQPYLTLQHVRDNIWSTTPRAFVTLLPNASTTHHIMVLHYTRTLTTTTTITATATTNLSN